MVDDEGLRFGWLEGDLPLGASVGDGVHCFLELCCRVGYAGGGRDALIQSRVICIRGKISTSRECVLAVIYVQEEYRRSKDATLWHRCFDMVQG